MLNGRGKRLSENYPFHPPELNLRRINVHEVEPIQKNDSSFGSADMDLVEMNLYDDYRRLDRELSTPKYLLRCRRKLMAKVSEFKEINNGLQKEVDQVRKKMSAYEQLPMENLVLAKWFDQQWVLHQMLTRYQKD